MPWKMLKKWSCSSLKGKNFFGGDPIGLLDYCVNWILFSEAGVNTQMDEEFLRVAWDKVPRIIIYILVF